MSALRQYSPIPGNGRNAGIREVTLESIPSLTRLTGPRVQWTPASASGNVPSSAASETSPALAQVVDFERQTSYEAQQHAAKQPSPLASSVPAVPQLNLQQVCRRTPNRAAPLSATSSAVSPRSSVYHIGEVDQAVHLSLDHCSQCGTSFTDDAVFCRHCGHSRFSSQVVRSYNHITSQENLLVRRRSRGMNPASSSTGSLPSHRSKSVTERAGRRPSNLGVATLTRSPTATEAVPHTTISLTPHIQAHQSSPKATSPVETDEVNDTGRSEAAAAKPQQPPHGLDAEAVKTLLGRVEACCGMVETCEQRLRAHIEREVDSMYRHAEAVSDAMKRDLEEKRKQSEDLVQQELAKLQHFGKDEEHLQTIAGRCDTLRAAFDSSNLAQVALESASSTMAEELRRLSHQATQQHELLQSFAGRCDTLHAAFDSSRVVQAALENASTSVGDELQHLSNQVSSLRAALGEERSERLAGEKSNAEAIREVSDTVLKEAQARSKACAWMEESLSEERALRGGEIAALRSQLEASGQARKHLSSLASKPLSQADLEEVRADFLGKLEEQRIFVERIASKPSMVADSASSSEQQWADLNKRLQAEREARVQMMQDVEEIIEARCKQLRANIDAGLLAEKSATPSPLREDGPSTSMKEASATLLKGQLDILLDSRLEAFALEKLRPLQTELKEATLKDSSGRWRDMSLWTKIEDEFRNQLMSLQTGLQTLTHEVEGVKRHTRPTASQAALEDEKRCENALASLRVVSTPTTLRNESVLELLKEVESLKVTVAGMGNDLQSLSEGYTRWAKRELEVAIEQDEKINAEARQRAEANVEMGCRLAELQAAVRCLGAGSPNEAPLVEVGVCSEAVTLLRDDIAQETRERKRLEESITQRIFELTEALRAEVSDRVRGDEVHSDRLRDALSEESIRAQQERDELRSRVSTQLEASLSGMGSVNDLATRLSEVEQLAPLLQEQQRGLGRETTDREAADARLEQMCSMLKSSLEVEIEGRKALMDDVDLSIQASATRLQTLTQEVAKANQSRCEDLQASVEDLSAVRAEDLACRQELAAQLLEVRKTVHSMFTSQGRGGVISVDTIGGELERIRHDVEARCGNLSSELRQQMQRLSEDILLEVRKESTGREAGARLVDERLRALEEFYEEVYDLFRDGFKAGSKRQVLRAPVAAAV